MPTKLIKIPYKHESVLDFLSYFIFSTTLSDKERLLMRSLILSADGGVVNISGEVARSIKYDLRMNDNTFNVCVGRIIKKGLIRKERGIITIAPVLLDVGKQETQYLVEFVPLSVK